MENCVIQFDSATTSFFTCMASIAFAVAGFAGAFNVFVAIGDSEQERRYLRTTFFIAIFIVFSAMMPLILEETKHVVRWCSIIISIPAAAIQFHIINEIRKKKVEIQNKKIFRVLFPASSLWIVATICNGVLVESFVFYKLSLVWAFAVHFYRFYLFITHVAGVHAKKSS